MVLELLSFLWFYVSETLFCCAVVAVEALVGLLIQSGQVQILTVLLCLCVSLYLGTCFRNLIMFFLFRMMLHWMLLVNSWNW